MDHLRAHNMIKFDSIWETAKMCAELHVISLFHESKKHTGYNPFPKGLLTQKGEYTREAKEKYNEVLMSFKEILEESTIET